MVYVPAARRQSIAGPAIRQWACRPAPGVRRHAMAALAWLLSATRSQCRDRRRAHIGPGSEPCASTAGRCVVLRPERGPHVGEPPPPGCGVLRSVEPGATYSLAPIPDVADDLGATSWGPERSEREVDVANGREAGGSPTGSVPRWIQAERGVLRSVRARPANRAWVLGRTVCLPLDAKTRIAAYEG
jgi:hypothetical protein